MSGHLSSLGVTYEQFIAACEETADPTYSSQVVDQILAIDDFLSTTNRFNFESFIDLFRFQENDG